MAPIDSSSSLYVNKGWLDLNYLRDRRWREHINSQLSAAQFQEVF